MHFSFSREPALYLFLVATGVRLFSAFILDVSTDTQALVNALATAIAGLIVAFAVARDGQVPAILGVIQALIALAVGLGFDLTAENQALIMTFVGGLAAAFVRSNVTAPVTADGDRVPA
jgi:hypothetical protein